MDSSDFQDFSSYYSQYFKKVYNYVFYRVGRSRQRAEDMTSEIFLKALEKFETFDHRKAFQSWIFRIAHNHVIDYYRARKPNPADIESVEHELKFFDRIIDKLIHREDMELVVKAMETLSDDYQDILNLKYFNDLSHDEVAEVTGKSVGNVRVIAHRALTALKKELDKQSDKYDAGGSSSTDERQDEKHNIAKSVITTISTYYVLLTTYFQRWNFQD